MANQTSKRRAFCWVSSNNGLTSQLERLEAQMSALYSSEDVRSHYEPICFAARDSQPAVSRALIEAVIRNTSASALEIGCGSAWLAERAFKAGLAESVYHGVDMEQSLMEENAKRLPNAHFAVGSVYSLPHSDNAFDVVFAHFVLEHCVYPERALLEMIRVLKPGGALLLVFPDFPALGILPSQKLGLREGNAKALLKQGHLLSAVVGLYDSRIRLRKALSTVVEDCGPFPVNIAPKCIDEGRISVPDADAVYIASKQEVAQWANAHGHQATFPAGTSGQFHATAFVEIRKGGS